ncbi:MAG: S8 family serine peptidase, partial [Myxococcota bacterium]
MGLRRLTPKQKLAILQGAPGDDIESAGRRAETMLNLSQVTAQQLMKIPGMTPGEAKRILNNRPFFSMEELLAVSTLSRALWEDLVSFPALTLPDPAANKARPLSIVPGRFVSLPTDLEAAPVGFAVHRQNHTAYILSASDLESADLSALKGQMRGRLVPVVRDQWGAERYFVPGHLDVWAHPNHKMDAIWDRFGLQVLGAIPNIGYFRVRFSVRPEADPLRHAIALADELSREDAIRWAELEEVGIDEEIVSASVDDLETAERDWNLSLINLPQAHQISQGAGHVVVFIIDTGMKTDHLDLSGGLHPEWQQRDLNYEADQPISAVSPHTGPAGNQHGTQVAGIVRQLAPRCRIVPIKITATGGLAAGYGLRAAAIQSAVVSLAANERGIINISWKTQSDHVGIREALRAAEAANVSVVTSAGNYPHRPNQSHFPSDYWRVWPYLKGLCAVAAVGYGDLKAGYTFYGDESVNVSAPGGELGGAGSAIFTTSGITRNVYCFGTSFAAPHVAGVLALMYGIAPQLTPEQARRILQKTGTSLDAKNPEFAGMLGSRIDAYAAVLNASGAQPSPITQPTASPTDTMPTDTMPTDTMPTDTMPTDTMP